MNERLGSDFKDSSVDIDKLTSITSKEIAKSGYDKENKKKLERLSECIDENNKINGEDKCKDFFKDSDQIKVLDVKLAEYKIRSEVINQQLLDLKKIKMKKGLRIFY